MVNRSLATVAETQDSSLPFRLSLFPLPFPPYVFDGQPLWQQLHSCDKYGC